MTIIRTIWAYLVSVATTLILSIYTIALSIFGYEGQRYVWIAHTWAKWIIWGSGVAIRVEGMENVRRDRPQIIASNHQSWFDVFTLSAILPKRFRFVAKEELRSIPLFGKAWQFSGHISIDRKDRVKAMATLAAAGILVGGDNSAIVIFPEGTRSATGELQSFKKGTFMLAASTGLEIVPTAVIGSRVVQRKGDWRVHSGPIIVRFGEAVDSSQFGEDNLEELLTIVRARVAGLLEHPLRKRDLE